MKAKGGESDQPFCGSLMKSVRGRFEYKEKVEELQFVPFPFVYVYLCKSEIWDRITYKTPKLLPTYRVMYE